jgi:hypothetical protein
MDGVPGPMLDFESFGVTARNIGYRYSRPCRASTWGRPTVLDAHRHQTPNARVRMMQMIVATRCNSCIAVALFSTGLRFWSHHLRKADRKPQRHLGFNAAVIPRIRLGAGVNHTSRTPSCVDLKAVCQ